MSVSSPPKKNTEYIFYIGLVSQANTKIYQANPTIAAGDFKVSIDGGALANPATLPAVTPAGSKMVKVVLAAAEMNGDSITLTGSDAAGDEWCDVMINIQTSVRQVDDLTFPATSGRSLLVDASGAIPINDLSAAAITDVETAVVNQMAATIADSIPADGTRPSINAALLMITRFLMEKSLSGTTLTVNKENGSTASMTFTINDASNPTSISRAT